MKFVPSVNTIGNHHGTMLQSKDEMHDRWTEYCSRLYKDHGGGDRMIKELAVITPANNEDPQDIL
jgi:hypothetical protein